MTTPRIGHAAFHKKKETPRHSGTRAGTKTERRAILKESMRHLDRNDIARHARLNANIVPTESHLNTAFVNDGVGGFKITTKMKDVLDYGDAREHRVRRKIMSGQRTVDLFVVHLPKSLCKEVKNFYPRTYPDGSPRIDPMTGEQMSRSRWVARDRDEAMRYFQDVLETLGARVIPGGQAAVHGWATNFDESTPHIQIMADPFAPDPKASESQPEALRTEVHQAYGSHPDVLFPPGTILNYPKSKLHGHDVSGKQIMGGVKIAGYQQVFRTIMADLGWPVDYAVGLNHGEELPLNEFKELEDKKTEVLRLQESVQHLAIQNEQWSDYLDDREAIQIASVELDNDEIAERQQLIAAREAAIKEEEHKLPALRKLAREKGRKEGYEAGFTKGEAMAKQDLATEVARARQLQRSALAARDAFLNAPMAVYEPLGEEMAEFFAVGDRQQVLDRWRLHRRKQRQMDEANRIQHRFPNLGNEQEAQLSQTEHSHDPER